VIWTLAAINIGAHVAAMALAALGMRPGTPAVALEARVAYLAAWPAGWIAGWAAWMLCAVADVAFIGAIAVRAPERSALAALAVPLAVAGAAIDLTFDTVHLTILPLLAGQGAPSAPLFLAAERIAWAGGAIVANGLYSAATLAVTLALAAGERIPRLATWAGVATFACGMGMCVAGFTGVARHLEIVSAPTIGCFIVWVFATARALAVEEG
jgi:hypothetical protein